MKIIFTKKTAWITGCRLLRLFCSILLTVESGGLLYAQTITGTVFNDMNANGLKESTEVGIQGVTVTAYAPNGTVLTPVTTNATGAYSISGLTGSTMYRIEFTGFPTAYNSGPSGPNSGTSVQFALAGATGVNLGLNYPSDYCQINPDLIVPCYVNGDNLGSNVSGEHVLVKIPYTASNTSPSPTPIADAGEIGPVFGTVIQRGSEKVFTSALLKRHVGLGPGGLGAIYVTDLTGPSSSTYLDLTNFGIDVGVSALGSRSLPNNTQSSSVDAVAFDLVGKAGLGGLAITDDEKTLYVANLYQRTLIAIEIGFPAKAGHTITSGDIDTYTLPSISCANGVARPFAVKYYKGKVYVGVVCTGENGNNANDLYAHILEFDHASRTFNPSPVLSFQLNYPKGDVHSSYPNVDKWMTWTSSWSGIQIMGSSSVGARAARPQPMLTDIAFADDGDLILGFADRAGHQTGYKQKSTSASDNQLYNGYIGGDLLRARKVSGTWTLENNGTLPGGQTGCGKGTNQGPGGGEFYCGDNFSGVLIAGKPPVEIHQETFIGGLAVVPGTNQTVVTVMDPINIWTGGFSWFSNTDGNTVRRYEIYESVNQNAGTWGKSAGLGVTDAVCESSPIEIGNRVWKDTDGDGVQDPGEPALQGVTVKLYAADGTTLLATAVTDANGSYYFSSASGTSTGNKIVGLNLQPLTEYYLKITSLGSHSSVTGITLNSITTGGSASLNLGTSLANNDAVLNAGIPAIYLQTGDVGENNHTFDFGFVLCSLNTTASNTGDYCAGETMALSVTGASGQATYGWSGPNSFSSTQQNPNINSASASKAGIYTVIVNDGGCKDTTTTQVIIHTITATAGGNSTCEGGTISLSSSVDGATTFSWSGPNGFSSIEQNPNISSVTTAAAGTYTVTVTGPGGCTATASTTVTVHSTMATASGGGTVCKGGTISLSASGGVSYSWGGPNGFVSSQQNPGISNVSEVHAGIYFVTVTGSNGCADVVSTTVMVGTVTPAAGSNSPVCAGGAINLTANGGASYVWSGPNGFTSTAQNPTITSAAAIKAGIYSVTVTSAGGCTAIATTNVIVNSVNATANGTDACVGGTISLTATGGTSYSWSGPNSFTSSAQNPTINNATAGMSGTYSVTVTSNGCTATASTTITVSSVPSAATGSGPICEGEIIQLQAGSGAISYSWTGPNGYTSSFQNPVIQNATTANNGTYTVTMTGSGGCAGTANVSITVYARPVVAAASDGPLCEGETLNLMAAGGGNYQWSGPNGFTTTEQNPSISNVTEANEGTYTVTVTSAQGCTATKSTGVLINKATASASTSTPSVCLGATIHLAATGGGTYTWSGPAGFASNMQNPSITNATSAMSGTYYVTVTNSNGCTAVAGATVQVNSVAAFVSSNSPVCQGEILVWSAEGGVSYSWSGPNGFSSTLKNPTIPYSLAANAGTYSVTVTGSNGCTGTASASVVINAPPVPTADKPVVCLDETIQLHASGGTGYSWSGPNGFISTDANPSILNATVANAGTYTLTDTGTGCSETYDVIVTDGQACLRNYAEIISSGLPDPANTYANNSFTEDDDAEVRVCFDVCTSPTFSFAQIQATCNEGAANNDTGITVTSIANGTHIGWSEGETYTGPDFAGATAITGMTYSIAGLDNPSGPLVYTVRIYNGGQCCFTETQMTLQPSPCPTAMNNGAVCQSFDVQLSATGGGTYSWSGPDGFSSTDQSPIATGMTITKEGTYTVTVTVGAMTATASTVVAMYDPPTVTATSNAPVPYGLPIELQATSVPAFSSYLWSGPDAFSSSAQYPSVASSAAAAGTYIVTVTDDNGCTNTAQTTVVTSPAGAPCVITATASADPVYCEGDTIYFEASGGQFYEWSGPNGFSTIVEDPVLIDVSDLHTGTYSVTVTDVTGGCTDVASITLAVSTGPVINASADETICQGGDLQLQSGGGGTYSWSGPNGFASPDQNPVIAGVTTASNGDYFVTVTDPDGCTNIDTVAVNLGISPIPDVTTTDGSICKGTSIDLDALMTNVGPIAADTAWFATLTDAKDSTNALLSSVVLPSVNTKYYVRLTSQANIDCYDIDSLTIMVAAILVSFTQTCNDHGTAADQNDDYFTIELTATNINPGSSGQYEVYLGVELLATGAYGNSVTIEWRDAANTLRFLADGMSTYTLTVQDTNHAGCSVSAGTTAENNCSTCPPPTCPPVQITKIPVGSG